MSGDIATVVILRVSGAREEHEVAKPGLLGWIHRMIGASCCDGVNLHDGKVMLVDDTGLIDGKQRNDAATAIYHSRCKPGTTSPICGDVAIVDDEDFA